MCTGGSAKQARDRRFQAILPLKGKILNVERKDDASIYKNNEISNLILGLGLGLKGEDVTNLRYGKVSLLHSIATHCCGVQHTLKLLCDAKFWAASAVLYICDAPRRKLLFHCC